MNCLCCGKKLNTGGKSKWHKACVKRFFGSSELPTIEIDEETLTLIAKETTERGYTVPGVQKKLSLHLTSESGRPRLTLVNYPTGYILKPQVEAFACIPEAEQLVMCMAESAGIKTVPHALIEASGETAYITKRVDRKIKNNSVKILAMEDFCQLDLRLTQDKYKGSYERCAKIIEKYSVRKGLDLTELFIRLVFSFLVGNSDMHLKNFSLIETDEASSKYVLSPAYDMLPVNIIIPEDTEEFALTMNGKKRRLNRQDFMDFAEKCGLQKTAAEKMISKLLSLVPKFTDMVDESLLKEEEKESLKVLIKTRADAIKTL